MATNKKEEMETGAFLSKIVATFGTKDCRVCEWLRGDDDTKLVLQFDIENKEHPGQPFGEARERCIRGEVLEGRG